MGTGIWIALVIFGVGGLGMLALIWLGNRWGAASRAQADATHSNETTDDILQAAVAPGHDPAALDRSLRDGSF